MNLFNLAMTVYGVLLGAILGLVAANAIKDFFPKRGGKAKRDPNALPTTYEEAIDYVHARTTLSDAEHPTFHFTGGMGIRNQLGLWDKESPLYQHMLKRFGLGHADDTCGLIVDAAIARFKNMPYDPAPAVASAKAHWRMFGVDAATQEKIKS